MKAFVLFASVGVVSSVASADFVPGAIAFSSLKNWTMFGMESIPAYLTVVDALDGFKTSPQASISGGSGWTAWTATSSGQVRGGSSYITTATVGDDLFFSFTGSTSAESGVHGIGGNFGFRNQAGQFQPGRIQLTLSTGASIVQEFTSKADFAGFWMEDPNVLITGMRLQPLGNAFTANYVSVDNLYFGGVPAPGALALLGVAGICTAKRRR
jgi:hypothetical protein